MIKQNLVKHFIAKYCYTFCPILALIAAINLILSQSRYCYLIIISLRLALNNNYDNAVRKISSITIEKG